MALHAVLDVLLFESDWERYEMEMPLTGLASMLHLFGNLEWVDVADGKAWIIKYWEIWCQKS